jgi:hypothetical protein
MSMTVTSTARATICVAAFIVTIASAGAQNAPYVPKQSDRPEPLAGDEAGFESIFDGKTLAGGEGDPAYWRVDNGALVGEITPATVVKSNTFIVWRGGRPRDFELKLDRRQQFQLGTDHRDSGIVRQVCVHLNLPGSECRCDVVVGDADRERDYRGIRSTPPCS